LQGAVNLSVDTMSVSESAAVLILVAYTLLVCLIPLLMASFQNGAISR